LHAWCLAEHASRRLVEIELWVGEGSKTAERCVLACCMQIRDMIRCAQSAAPRSLSAGGDRLWRCKKSRSSSATFWIHVLSTSSSDPSEEGEEEGEKDGEDTTLANDESCVL
jgi:hypothetical protein